MSERHPACKNNEPPVFGVSLWNFRGFPANAGKEEKMVCLLVQRLPV